MNEASESPDSEAESPSPTDQPLAAERYVSQGGGWSVVVPSRWEVVAKAETGGAFVGHGGIAEILIQPATGLALEKLAERQVKNIRSNWEGADEIESEIVQLPAGNAVRIAFATASNPDVGRLNVYFYFLELGDTQYVLSVRGGDRDLATIAAALAESLRITN